MSRASILGIPIYTLGAEKIQINDNIHDLNTEIYKALSSTSCTGKTMKNDSDILMMNNIIKDLGYTGLCDRKSYRRTFFTKSLTKLIGTIQKIHFMNL